jgi:hypothetical protein
MKTQNEIKTLAKKALDLYIYKHISIGIAIALVTKDIHVAVRIKEYIDNNF